MMTVVDMYTIPRTKVPVEVWGNDGGSEVAVDS